jgi:hypothetical protein
MPGSNSDRIYLPELFESLKEFIPLDRCDWHSLTRYATKWHLSLADALLDMRFTDETSLAKALARARNLPYLPSKSLLTDARGLSFDCLEDLLNVGALPIAESKLAICNPYDDHRGLLRPDLAARDMVVTERSPLFSALHTLCMRDWHTEEPTLADMTSAGESRDSHAVSDEIASGTDR